MKKILLLLLALSVIIVAVLSGCASNDGKSPGNSANSPVAPSPPITDGGDIPPQDDGEDNEGNLPPETGNETPKPPIDATPTTPTESVDRLFKANSDGVNIRSGAGTNYSSVGSMDKNDALPYLGQTGDWYKTTYKGKTAYVNSKNCSDLIMKKSIGARESVIVVGKTLLGYPYVYGAERVHYGNGQTNSKFNSRQYDCSSFTQYAYFKGQSILIATTSRSQSIQGKAVTNMQRGDLMFFTNSSRQHLSGIERIGHVAIYLGDNYILHTASDFAVIEPISSTRWSYFVGARSFF